ncbi:TPA: TolC family protein [Legionella pneumophila]
MRKKDVLLRIIPIIYLFWRTSFALAQNLPLTLTEAEHLAINKSPELQRLNANSQALIQQSIADRQLPDPQLAAGTINVPTDTFSFTQDEMTMVQVGLQQQFARGRSLKMKSQQTRALAKTERTKIKEQKLTLIRTVREVWLELYYWTEALRTLKANERAWGAMEQPTDLRLFCCS